MKKTLALILALCMLLALCACTQEAPAETPAEPEKADTEAVVNHWYTDDFSGSCVYQHKRYTDCTAQLSNRCDWFWQSVWFFAGHVDRFSDCILGNRAYAEIHGTWQKNLFNRLQFGSSVFVWYKK